MRVLKGTDFNDRSKASLEAKQALLERFKARPAADDPELLAKQEERRRIIEAREAREAERRRLREEEEARRRAAEEEERLRKLKEAEEARERLLAEQKAARDRRYALRKARR